MWCQVIHFCSGKVRIKMNRKEQMTQLRQEGKTYQEIGKVFKVSRGRTHQIVTGYKPPINRIRKRYYGMINYNKYRRKRFGFKAKKSFKYKKIVLEHYSKGTLRCAKCGMDNIYCLEIDHKYENGAEERRNNQKSSGLNFYLWLIRNNFPKGFQVLCRNCNWLKYLIHRGVIKK